MMKEKNTTTIILLLIAFLALLPSCSDSKKEEQVRRGIIINELMPSNRTGLMRGKKKPMDWIELKNISNDTIDLEGFQLEVVKERTDSLASEEDEESAVWEFPSIKIAGGECFVIFADKSKKEKAEGEENNKKEKSDKAPRADLNLPKEGATVRILSPGGKTITEMKYGAVPPDRSVALQPDSTYSLTWWQSPGFENTREGYEKAVELMDSQRKDPLKIWELMSRAHKAKDNWVELKNTGEEDIELSDYQLTQRINKKEESWQLPQRKLKPGEIVTVQLTGGKGNPYNPLHAKIKLGKAETLVLTKNGKFVDGVCAKPAPYGASVGRAEGKKGFFFYSKPTRNQENGSEGRRFITDRPEFDIKAGVYPKKDSLTVKLLEPTRTVRYTLDGTEPTSSSPVLKDSLLITSATVLRAYAEGDSVSLNSPIATNTYLLGAEHDMAVMNVTVNENDLYHPTHGIYVKGPGFTEEWPHTGANYWKPMTKKAHVELFDGKEGFAVDCGLKIFGGFSRALSKKSFTLKFKGMYGENKVEYDFFGTGTPMEVNDLVLRSGSQDYMRCMVRDEYFTSLLGKESPELLIQQYRPVALYINAKYFGLYYIREKIDRHFVARKLDLPSDSVNIIMSLGYNEEGSKEPYKKLINYISTNDMKQKEHYEYVKNNVDLQGLVDYKLGEIYSGNSDVGNIRYVRSTAAESDKKWHFVFYDIDASWVGDKPTAEYYLHTGPVAANANVTHHNIMISRLMNNPEFRQLFLQRLSHHLTKTFSAKNAEATFDALVEQIRPEMKRNCERWPELSYERWEKNIAEFRQRFADRPKKILNDIRACIGVTPEENKKYFAHLGY